MKRFLFFSVVSLFSLTVSAQNWVQLGNDINGEAAGDQSGYYSSISSDGNTVAVGSVRNDGGGTDAGHVRVYSYNGSIWVQKGSDIDGAAAEDSSGRVGLSADGNTVAIGAPLNDEAGNGYGHVRVFDFNGTDWVQRGASITGDVNNDQSGWAVDISADGNRVVIGARGDEGRVRVYSWNGSVWVQLGSTIHGTNYMDELGGSVAISADGTTFIAGAKSANSNGNQSGEVRIYKYDGTDWILKGNILAGDQSGAAFGVSVDISADGNTIIGGENRYKLPIYGDLIGRVRVFSWNGSTWDQKGQNFDGIADTDYIGSAVTINDGGNVIAFRGALDGSGNNNGKGRAAIYYFNETEWLPAGSPIEGQNDADLCGWSLSLNTSGKTIITGSPYNGNNGAYAGHARVFRYNGSLEITENIFTDISIYPNPSTGNFTIDLGKEYTDVSVGIYNMLGQIISSDRYTSAKTIEQQINASAGIYFVKVRTAKEGSNTLRFIKQ